MTSVSMQACNKCTCEDLLDQCTSWAYQGLGFININFDFVLLQNIKQVVSAFMATCPQNLNVQNLKMKTDFQQGEVSSRHFLPSKYCVFINHQSNIVKIEELYQGHCRSAEWKDYMSLNCMKTCNKCGYQVCEDTEDQCSKWAVDG